MSELEEKQEEGVLIYGLFMEGCRWDSETTQLEDPRPGEMNSLAPIILFTPTESIPEPGDYSMPLYKTSERAGLLSTTGHSTNYILSIDCPTAQKSQYWVLRGAAFLCQLND